MKKTILLCTFATILLLAACKKDPVTPQEEVVYTTGNTIRGSLLQSPTDQIDSVYAKFNNSLSTVFAKSSFDGKNFTLTLPSSLEDSYLNAITDGILVDFKSPITISDTTALISPVLNLYAIQAGVNIGTFNYGNLISFLSGDINPNSLPVKGDAYIEFIYANKNVSIKSTSPDILDAAEGIKMSVTANANLVAGWNQIAIVFKNSQINTTTGNLELNLEVTTLGTSNQKWSYDKFKSQSMMNFRKSLTSSIKNSK